MAYFLTEMTKLAQKQNSDIKGWCHGKCQLLEHLLFIIFFTFTPEQVNSLSHFLTASGTLYILNLFSLAPVHLPMDIVKPLFFFHLLLQGHFFSFKAFFLNLHMSVYSLVMQKLCPLQFGYFPTISDCQHLHWYLVYKSWERKKRVAPKIQKHSTTGLCL